MTKLPQFTSMRELRYGHDPRLDAWLLHFMTENNIEPNVRPGENAQLEQLRFMVDVDDNQVFVPCSDEMFENLLHARMSSVLQKEYRSKWRTLVHLVRINIQDRYTRRKIFALSRHKMNSTLHTPFLIPSRFLKQLLTIFMAMSGVHDPQRMEKRLANKRALDFIQSPALSSYLYSCPDSTLGCTSINSLRWELDLMELSRLCRLGLHSDIWNTPTKVADTTDVHDLVCAPWPEFNTVLTRIMGPESGQKQLKILLLPDESGEIIFDLRFIRVLIRLGHKVIIAFKEGFFLNHPQFWDVEHDSALKEALEDAMFIENSRMSKNELLRAQRENSLLVISDGTRERMNLWRTSVTFARAWKEADLIIAKGYPNYRRFIMNSHVFTRDILCLYRDDAGCEQVAFKEKSPRITKITEVQIVAQADAIIARMRQARSQGKQVMFYSAIIGSIPGQTQVALKVVNTFVAQLRSRHTNIFIINPAEHFVPGMDGDDLMYMWERVQRSGFINVWRFQTVNDIETSFELMGEAVPAQWHGKDSTFSTGCTKEMHIALDVQNFHPELQIIGPDPKRFFRRMEYGVGKYFDARITDKGQAL
ncbi:MAG: protein-glutamate O-methyltransferase family protein [Desulfovibrionales bacterium]|nr:protein-glutamate O-methyltransferase family protein [Desulfovibrionales bacterium]